MTAASAHVVRELSTATSLPALGTCCVHCGEALGAQAQLLPALQDQTNGSEATPAWVCCVGCLAAMNFAAPELLSTPLNHSDDGHNFAGWDRAELMAHMQPAESGGYVVNLAVDAVHCPNCAWLIELSLQRISPDLRVSVDVPLRMLRLQFDPAQQPLSKLVAALNQIGYPARLIHGASDHKLSNKSLKQLFVAGLCALQAMMFAEPLYWSNSDLPLQTAQFFAWLSALITLPAISYSGSRFFTGARNELRLGRPAIDSLIALSLLLAFIGSGIGLLRGSQAVYFDAIAMFIFVLLLGRLLEANVMAKARAFSMRLQDVMPAMARLASGGLRELHKLKFGDCLQAVPGEVLIADGVLQSASCVLSNAMFDGEAAPTLLLQGAPVFAGASVASGICVYQITALGENTQLAQIARASQQTAAAQNPSAAETALMATRFTLAVMALAICTSIVWWLIAPERALAVTLSVLTVACPCALGLALPLTRALAHACLQRLGVILLQPDALDRIAQVDCVMFDKTGTLTMIDAKSVRVATTGSLSTSDALGIARALEVGSTHPLARPLSQAADAAQSAQFMASAVEHLPGLGVRGVINGALWRLGKPALSGLADADCVVLSGPQASATFDFQERLQQGAIEAVSALKRLGIATQIVSGDSQARVQALATRLGISRQDYRCTPTEKSALAKAHRAAGRFPMMLGDGVNDAIALAGAHVAVSLGAANPLARMHADVLLLNDDLKAVPALIRTARQSVIIARQNLLWARAYNVVAIPLAALGCIGPVWAAVGMAASSLLVSLNAARLLHKTPKAGAPLASVKASTALS